MRYAGYVPMGTYLTADPWLRYEIQGRAVVTEERDSGWLGSLFPFLFPWRETQRFTLNSHTKVALEPNNLYPDGSGFIELSNGPADTAALKVHQQAETFAAELRSTVSRL